QMPRPPSGAGGGGGGGGGGGQVADTRITVPSGQVCVGSGAGGGGGGGGGGGSTMAGAPKVDTRLASRLCELKLLLVSKVTTPGEQANVPPTGPQVVAPALKA